MAGHSIGWVLIAAGAALLLVGLLALTGGLSWFGRLPGDIRIERDSVRVYIPIVSMLVVSVVLTVLFRLLRRFIH
jgi:membrane protein implicated in regulation of membrane protease activity